MMEIMPSFDHDNQNSRVLIHNALILRGLPFSYQKLPKQLLKLSILKLDGSSFGVEVSMNATVADLKLSLEEFFRLSPMNEGCIVSWSHVWGHFCLCYEGQKLLNDKAYIRRLGIKDGDQIKFLRHVTMPTRQQIKNQKCSMSSADEDEKVTDTGNCDSVNDQEADMVEYQISGSKLSNFLRGCFSCKKCRNDIVQL